MYNVHNLPKNTNNFPSVPTKGFKMCPSFQKQQFHAVSPFKLTWITGRVEGEDEMEGGYCLEEESPSIRTF
jgi:hypothetical protein